MRTWNFAPFTRRPAEGVSRRTSLLTIGGAALAATSAVAAMAHPGVSAAKKKSSDKCKKNEQQRCANDAAACRSTQLAYCEGNTDCAALLNPCCDACSVNGFFTCYIEVLTSQTADARSHRHSLAPLGGAALVATAATSPSRSGAKKRSGTSCKKKATKRCRHDVAACEATVAAFCDTFGEPGCFAEVNPCCAECSANAILTCLITLVE
jgi:hypothetical protein